REQRKLVHRARDNPTRIPVAEVRERDRKPGDIDAEPARDSLRQSVREREQDHATGGFEGARKPDEKRSETTRYPGRPPLCGCYRPRETVGRRDQHGEKAREREVVGVSCRREREFRQQGREQMAAVVVLHGFARKPEVLRREGGGAKQRFEQTEIEELLAAAGMHRGIDRPHSDEKTEGNREDHDWAYQFSGSEPIEIETTERERRKTDEYDQSYDETCREREMADPVGHDPDHCERERERERRAPVGQSGEKPGSERESHRSEGEEGHEPDHDETVLHEESGEPAY